MANMLTCSQGHTWNNDGEAGYSCPSCGETGEAVEASFATEKGGIDELPPPPRNSRSGVRAAAEWPRIAGYEIEGMLGRGGMGVVYKARQLSLGRVVALKMILTGIHLNPEALARFRAEAQTLARVQHPNIVHIYDVMEVEGTPCFAMEFVEGGSLEEQLHGRPMTPEGAAALVRTLARAVHAAHERGVIHRDLKPANILIAVDHTPKITDFGLAKRLDEESKHTKTGNVMGTPHYMAPEQAEGMKGIGPTADVYALGAILYEALTGVPPFRGDSTAHILKQVLFDEPAPPSRIHAPVPPLLERICLKCLSKDPGKRYATARALADELDRFFDGSSTQAKGAVPASPSKKPVWVLATMLVLTVVVSIGFVPGVRDWFSSGPVVLPAGPLTPHWDLLARPAAEEGEAFDRIAFPMRAVGYLASRRALYKTEDAGKHWTPMKLDLPGRVNVLHFTDEKTGWLGTDQLRQTSNGGDTWTDVPLGAEKMRSVTAVAFHSNGWGLVGGTTHEGERAFFRRPDANAIWEKVAAAGDLKQHARWFVARFVITSPDSALAVLYEGVDGGGAVLQTKDGGRLWSKIFTYEEDLYDAHVNKDGNGWLAAPGGAFWRTADGGATFQPFDTKLDDMTPTCLAFDPSGKLGIAPLWKGKVLLRIGNPAWTRSDIPLGYALPHAVAVDAECGYVLGADGQVARLTLRR